MKTNKFFKKAQSLPLDTIVIAMLVIIVMLVIVVFFTSSVGKTGDQLDENSASVCSPSNPALNALGYENIKSEDDVADDGCENGRVEISIIHLDDDEDGDKMICCRDK